MAGISDMGLDEIDADQQCDPLPKDPPTDYEQLREFANEEVIDWVGLQVPGTEVLMSHHPGTRTIPGVIRTAQGRYTNTRGASHPMSCKRLMTNSVQLRQKEEVEKKVQEVSVSESTPKRQTIAAINWRWDSTTMYLKLNDEQSALRFKWIQKELELSKHLDEDDISRVAGILNVGRAGFLHVNSSRARLRWGIDPENSERIILKPSVLQRNSSGCLRKALNLDFVGCENLVLMLCPHVGWLTRYMGATVFLVMSGWKENLLRNTEILITWAFVLIIALVMMLLTLARSL